MYIGADVVLTKPLKFGLVNKLFDYCNSNGVQSKVIYMENENKFHVYNNDIKNHLK